MIKNTNEIVLTSNTCYTSYILYASVGNYQDKSTFKKKKDHLFDPSRRRDIEKKFPNTKVKADTFGTGINRSILLRSNRTTLYIRTDDRVLKIRKSFKGRNNVVTIPQE